MKKQRIKKVLAKAAIGGLLMSSMVPYNVFANSGENIIQGTSISRPSGLTNVTGEQVNALNKFSATYEIKVDPKINVNNAAPVRVIVEFNQAPAKVAVIQQQVEGNEISLKEATQDVNDVHKQFKEFVQKIDQLNSGNAISNYAVTPNTDTLSNSIYQPEIEITNEYKHAFNGVAMTLPGTYVAKLLDSGLVSRVVKDEVVKLDPSELEGSKNTTTINVNGSVDSSTTSVTQQSTTEQNNYPNTIQENSIPLPGIEDLHNEGIKGNGIKVGVIDTGVDYNHPDLTDAYKGYRKADGENPASINPTTVKGWDFVDNDADPMETTVDDWKKAGSPVVEGHSYETYHGTHVSGTIAGQGKNNVEFPSLGVAPKVDLYGYRALGPYGSGDLSAVLGAIDKAVIDGMDVVNMSLGATVNDPLYPTSTAVNNATIAGVTFVISAGNSGSAEGTLGSPGTSPLAITVGANDFPMNIPTGSANVGSETFNNMKLLGRGYNDNLNSLVGKSYPVVYVGLGGVDDFKDANGAQIDLTGKVALIQRGTYGLADKVRYAKNAGAAAVIMYNNVAGEIDSYLAQETGLVPAFRLTKADGERLKTAAATSLITFNSVGSMFTEGYHLAGFSSRGPVAGSYDIKPDIIGPGVSVYSTYPEFIHSPEDGIDYSSAYARISGTSMASPHIAGVAALILQAHPDYTPADVKEALQNTADKLSDDYSVYEVGAGLVDVKEAVHSDVKIEVLNKALHYSAQNGTDVLIDDLTGSIVYGTVYKKSSAANTGTKNVKIKNKGTQSKQFDISYEYSKAKTGVLDAVANNVTITTTAQSVTVAAGASSDLTATISVPSNATSGRYEGYVNIVNHDNPQEKYRVPFAVRIVDKGIGSSKMSNPASSQVSWLPAHPFMPSPNLAGLQYRLNSPMKSVRLFIYDKDGRPLGTTTPKEETSNTATKLLDRTITTFVVTNDYLPWAGDPNDEKIDANAPHGKLTEGQYYVKLRAIDEDGVTKYETPMQLFVVDNKLPELTFKDHAPGVYELKDSDFKTETMNGEAFNAFWVHTRLYDEGTSKLASTGITQSANTLWYYYNQKVLPDGDFPLDNAGNTKFGIEKQDIENGPATITLFPMDAAYNAHLLNEFYNYAFIKEGSPYVVPTYDKHKLYKNDTLTMTLNLNNVEKLMSGSYDASFYKGYLQFADVKVNKKFQEYADAHGITVKVDDPVINPNPDAPNHQDIVKVGAHLTGDEGFSGDIPFLDVTFKLYNDEYNILYSNINPELNTTTFSYTKQGETEATKIPAFNQIDSFKIIQKHHYIASYVKLEGVGTNSAVALSGLSKFVTSAYAQTSDGKKYLGTITEKTEDENPNYIDIHSLPVSNDPYNIVFEAPGYLKSIQKVTLGTKTPWGEDVGVIKYVGGAQPKAIAGEVNGDGIIDVLDAKQVYDKMGQQDNVNYLIEDFNKDGIVDKKDLQFVATNIYLKNPDVTANPKEVIKVDGKDMYATDFFNLAKLFTNVNTFKVISKNAISATFNWKAVDPAGVGSVKIQQQASTDGITWPTSWTDSKLASPITVDSTGAVVTGLSDNTFYRFRLVVNGGLNGTLSGGNSNVVQMTTAFTMPTVDVVDDNDTTITGKADPNLPIEVYNGKQMVTSGNTDADGNYSIDIKTQKAGTVLKVIAYDDMGRQGDVSVTVLDRTAPNVLTVDTVDDNDTSITGITEANATVVVKNNNNTIATGIADEEGKFNISLSAQKAGTVLTVKATDADGNGSEEASITVLDRTAPNVPKINAIDDNDKLISGLAEANATVVVKNNNNAIATGKANAEGKFSIVISPQKAGTVLTAIATDAAGNNSEKATITVLDRTAPNAPKVNPIDDNDTKISGLTEAYAKVVVKTGSKTIVTGTADSLGKFSITISKQKAGTVLSVTSTDKAGNQSSATSIKVLDKTAPNAPIISTFKVVNRNQTYITGTAEANSTIVVKVGTKVVTKVIVSSTGTFKVNLYNLVRGTNTITLYAVDNAGNKSPEVKRSVTIK